MDKKIKGADAHQILNNPVFRDALNVVRDSLIRKSLISDGSDAKKIIISMQLLEGIVRALNQFMEDGQIVDFIESHKQKEDQAKKTAKEFNRGY